MYPFNFEPSCPGLNPTEVFVVMPFDSKYDKVFTELIQPSVKLVETDLSHDLYAYRTKDDLRTISGWNEVMEHLYPAQVVLGVLTKEINANVYYELGIAHATQVIQRQVLIAEEGYKPQFDTKDLIFMKYSPEQPEAFVKELAERIKAALNEWNVEEERIVKNAIANISPIEFEILMHWGRHRQFSLKTSAGGPTDYEVEIATVHGGDSRFMQGVFERHCAAIGKLQQAGLLGLDTDAEPGLIKFSYWWTDLGNLVLLKFKQIDNEERKKRYQHLPQHLHHSTSSFAPTYLHTPAVG